MTDTVISASSSKSWRDGPAVSRELWLLLGIVCMLGLTWWVSRMAWFTPESDLGYALGVAGGSMMALLFAYPLRKRLAFMQNWGKTRHWFWWHMMLGILGPTAILLHAGYAFGSLNATIAFSAMACVAVSGVLGRFVYARIHHGLYGRRATLKEMQAGLGLASRQGHSVLVHWPRVEERLQQFESRALKDGGALARAWNFLALPFAAAWLGWICRRELSRSVHASSRQQGGSSLQSLSTVPSVLAAQQVVEKYLDAVVRVARFRAFERLFAMWHVLHVPLVWMMVLCAVAHVVAVHIY